MTPGIPRFAVTRLGDIKTCFELFMPLSLKSSLLWQTLKENKSMATCGKTLMRNTWMLILVVVFLLECTDPATRPLIVSGTHRQEEIFSGQQCHFRPLKWYQESSDLPEQDLTSLPPSGLSGRDGCSSFHSCSTQGQRWQWMNVLSLSEENAPSDLARYGYWTAGSQYHLWQFFLPGLPLDKNLSGGNLPWWA